MTEPMFNPIFGLSIDWDYEYKPVEVRPISSKYYQRRHVIQAIRHPNMPLVIRNGDAPFSTLGCKPYSGPWPPNGESTEL